MGNKIKIKKLKPLKIEDPSNVKIRWPVIKLALNRIERVRGRIILLITSMITINGIRKEGVLLGTRWAKALLGKKNQR